MTGRYRKKPVVIDAVQFVGNNHVQVCDFLGGEKSDNHTHEDVEGRVQYPFDLDEADEEGTSVPIHTLEGTMHALNGDWVIRGVQGEFYPCKPDIFAATYEPAPTAPEAQ